MEDVVAPVFHNKLPVAVVLKVELPQLSASVTVGVDTELGDAVPVPEALVQPLTVAVTL